CLAPRIRFILRGRQAASGSVVSIRDRNKGKNMKSATMRMICRILIVSLMLLPFQAVQAGMIGTDRVAALASAQADRATVLSFASRSDVAGQLQGLGLDPANAKDRVAAMTDQEVRSLAGNLNSLPAGADSGLTWAVVIVLAIVLYFYWR
ncbi:MAG: PA2779 family protein, partial [Sulfuricaulis sp.]|nr:PA2779 family protein [Sulfuricaulis sp.]